MQERRVQELGVVRGVKCYPEDTEKALEDLAMQRSLVTSLQESSLPEVVGKKGNSQCIPININHCNQT